MALTHVRVSPGMQRMMAELKQANLKKLGVWRIVENTFTASVQQNFDSQGRPQGWKPTQDAYRTTKQRTTTQRGKARKRKLSSATASRQIRGGKGIKTLQRSQKLRKAATGTKSSGYFSKASPDNLIVGIKGVAYAARHNFGYPGGSGRGRAPTPRRTFFQNPDGSPAMLPSETDDMHRQIEGHLHVRLTAIKNSGRL